MKYRIGFWVSFQNRQEFLGHFKLIRRMILLKCGSDYRSSLDFQLFAGRRAYMNEVSTLLFGQDGAMKFDFVIEPANDAVVIVSCDDDNGHRLY